MILNHKYIEALKQLLQTGMERAASIINDGTQSTIALTIGSVRVFSQHEMANYLEPERQYRASVVEVDFSEAISGKAFLVFSVDRAAKFALLLLNDDEGATDMDAIRNSVFLEIGNILLNGIMEVLAEHGGELRYSVPTYFETISDELITLRTLTANDVIVLSEVCCSIANQYTVCGSIIMLLKPQALMTVLSSVQSGTAV